MSNEPQGDRQQSGLPITVWKEKAFWQKWKEDSMGVFHGWQMLNIPRNKIHDIFSQLEELSKFLLMFHTFHVSKTGILSKLWNKEPPVN